MKGTPTLLFQHGWAFDASLWDALRAQLEDWPQAVAQAPYFADAIVPAIDGPVVVIAHSYGFMRALEAPWPRQLGLVSINGFSRFARAPDFPHGLDARVLSRMLARLGSDCEAVVDEFRKRCGAAPMGAAARAEALRRDLEGLSVADERARLAACPTPVLALAGGADPIVPPAMTRDALGGREAAWVEDGGHLLPMSHPAWCAQRIRAFLDTLDLPPHKPRALPS